MSTTSHPKPKVVNNYYQHDIASLANLANLQLVLNEQQSIVQFKNNWELVCKWSEEARYETQIDSKTAKNSYRAIANSRNGVLVWLKKYW